MLEKIFCYLLGRIQRSLGFKIYWCILLGTFIINFCGALETTKLFTFKLIDIYIIKGYEICLTQLNILSTSI